MEKDKQRIFAFVIIPGMIIVLAAVGVFSHWASTAPKNDVLEVLAIAMVIAFVLFIWSIWKEILLLLNVALSFFAFFVVETIEVAMEILGAVVQAKNYVVKTVHLIQQKRSEK